MNCWVKVASLETCPGRSLSRNRFHHQLEKKPPDGVSPTVYEPGGVSLEVFTPDD